MNKIKFLLCFALLVSGVEGRGQIYIDSYRFAAAAVSGDLLLDSFPNSEGAWSLRKLDKDYAGNCITIRRSSNGDTTNIGFVDNYLDTATLKTFCSGTNCFVRRWYDQSGNNRHAEQTTDANQPTIATAGVIFYKNGTPSLDFDATNDVLTVPNSTSSFNFIHNGTSSAIFFAAHHDVAGTSVVLGSNAGTGSNVGHNAGQITTSNAAAGVSNGGANVARAFSGNNGLTLNTYIASILFDVDNATTANRLLAYINGSATVWGTNSDTATPTTNNASNNLQFGAAGNNAALQNGGIKEIIYYGTDQTSNRTAICNNINTFYSIY